MLADCGHIVAADDVPLLLANRNDQRMSVYVVAHPRNQTSGSDDEKARALAGFFIA
jgi:hypothetical protein